MPENSGMANTPKITEVANTKKNKSKLKTCESKNVLLYYAKHDTGINHNSTSKMSKMPHFNDLTLLDVHLGTFKSTGQDVLHYYYLFTSPLSFYLSFHIPQS